jgi:hypothetical protein
MIRNDGTMMKTVMTTMMTTTMTTVMTTMMTQYDTMITKYTMSTQLLHNCDITMKQLKLNF